MNTEDEMEMVASLASLYFLCVHRDSVVYDSDLP